MNQKNPFDIIKRRYVTEKATMLSNLKNAESNPCIRKCQSPKYVFLVDPAANKQQIAEAVEEIYAAKNIKVTAVNTINQKPKQFGRRGRMRPGVDKHFKKAIVTLAVNDSLDD